MCIRDRGHQEDARRFEALGEEIRTAILQEYFTPSGRFALDTQTSYVLALHYGIYRDRQRVIDAFKALSLIHI